MKVGKTKMINGKEIINVLYNGKEFYRFIGKKLQWKRAKSNHIVNKELHEVLESAFNGSPKIKEPSINIPSNFIKAVNKIETKNELDIKIYSMCENFELLQAVKLYKDHTGVGLREAKNYVDTINRMAKARKKFYATGSTDSDALRQVIVNAYFESMAARDEFAKKMKLSYDGKNALTVVKMIKDVTNLGLAEAKYLFDNYIKI
jgi:ribosomal protein L7/L12